MSWDVTISRWAAVAVLAVLLTGACGSGAIEGPGDHSESAETPTNASDSAGGDDPGGSDDPGGGGGGQYSWDLPVGDISPDDALSLYYALRQSCDKGEAYLSGSDRFYSPNVLQLYRAAIAICRGDIELGRELYQGSETGGWPSACLVNEAVLSVLDQRPQNISACPYPRTGVDPPTLEGRTATSSTTEPGG